MMGSKRSKPKEKKYVLEFGGFALFFWSFALLFLLGWIFVLGILIGRGFLDDKIEDTFIKGSPLAGLYKDDDKSGKTADPASEETRRREEPEFAFYERLPEEDNGTGGGTAAGRTKQKDATTNENPSEVGPPPFNPEETSETLERNTAPPSGQVEAGPLEKKNDWRFTVQIASTKDRMRAMEMVEKFEKSGYPAFFYKVDIRNKTYYRVSCGRFDTRNKAEKFKDLLSLNEKIDGIIMERKGGERAPVARNRFTKPQERVEKKTKDEENRFTIQIASLADRRDAGTIVARLEDKGYTVYSYRAIVDGKTYYRVRCGRFKTRKDAENFKVLLGRRENIHGFVTKIEE